MLEKLLLNDIHLGVQRSGGTTQDSARQLQEYLLASFERMIFEHSDKDLIINGDLFDQFFVSMLTMLGFYNVMRNWLQATRSPAELLASPYVALGMGNHDWSKDDSRLSSFAFVGRLLQMEFGDRVKVITKPTAIDEGIYMVPHMPNQDLFNIALEETERYGTDCGGGLLLLHANYDNNFAVQSDHSLNVSEEQAKKLAAAGWTLIFGHEHQARTELDGKVIITGNQWPSSIADCLNNPHGMKCAHIIDTDWHLIQVPTWGADKDFAQVDWRDLPMFDGTQRFIRVIGQATAEESPQVIDTIAKFRKVSDAFVVTNGVEVEGVKAMDDLPATVDNIKSFDVIGFLLEHLDNDRQREVVKKLYALEQGEALEEAA